MRARAIVALIVVATLLVANQFVGERAPVEEPPTTPSHMGSSVGEERDENPPRRHVERSEASPTRARLENAPAAPLAEPPEPSETFEVRVTDARDGSAVPNAIVRYYDDIWDMKRDVGGESGQPSGVIETEADGIAHVPWPEHGLPAVEVLAAGFSASELLVIASRPDGSATIEITLHRPVSILVRVVDETTSQPIAQVELELHRDSEVVSTGTTLHDGTGSLHGAIYGRKERVGVSVDGYAPIEVLVEVGTGEDPPQIIELTPAAVLIGHVVTSVGAPAPGVTVRAVPTSPPATASERREVGRIVEWTTPALVAVTDEQGRFRLPGLLFDRTYVASTWFPEAGVLTKSAALDPRSLEAEIELVLPATGSLVVIVRDGEEQPPAATSVTAGPVATPIDFRSSLDSERGAAGRFLFTALLPGTYDVEVAAEGLVRLIVPATVVVGVETEIAINLERTVDVSGVVVDERGEPVPNIVVSWQQGGLFHPSFEREPARTDSSGRFRLTGLASGPVELGVWAKTHRADLVKAAAPASGVRITARRVATVKVRVHLPSGVEPPDAIAHTQVFLGSGESDPLSEAAQWRGSKSQLTFENGVADVRFDTLGPSRIVIVATGFAPVVCSSDPHPGTTVVLPDVMLDRGRSLTGHVHDDQGRPLANATVELLPWTAAAGANAITDADGAFRIDHLPDGPFTIRAGAQPHWAGKGTVELSASTAPLVVTLARFHVIFVKLVDANGELQPGRTATYVLADSLAAAEPLEMLELPGQMAGVHMAQVSPGIWRVRLEGDSSAGVDLDATEKGASAVIQIE